MIEQVELLYISPEQFRASPQVGTPCRMPWESLATYLSRPTTGKSKDEAGGYALGRYAGNVRRKAALEETRALVVDVDEDGDVQRVAEVVGRYRAIVHETFSSTPEAPRCRLLLALDEPIDAATYEKVHGALRAQLRLSGVVADEGAKDVSRLSFAPVRRPGAGFVFVSHGGECVRGRAVLAALPPPPPAPVIPLHREMRTPEMEDRYVGAAIVHIAVALARCTPGQRHYELLRGSWALARFEALSEDTIVSAILGAFVLAAGETRRAEGERTIRDAVRARRGGR